HVVNLGIHPNYIINTGRGIQPVYFIERSDYETWRTVNAGLYNATKVIGADKLDTDSSRVFKLPGYPSFKEGQANATGVLFAADKTGGWNRAEVLKQRFPAPTSTSYTVTNVGPATGEQPKELIATGVVYPESDVVKWMQSGRLLHEGNPRGDDHVDR